ncbi:kinase-like domain-containing protein [Globomyces pollinis-pini]|nr:kinase-like domain-containing protein [Globomyces pollinis-pini]
MSLLQLEDNVIKGKWRMIHVLGKGAFGEVYQAIDLATKELVAVKVESSKSKKPILKLEISILKRLSHSETCEYIASGRFIAPHLPSTHQQLNPDIYTYLVMTLLGENLSEVRKRRPNGKFSIATTCLLGKQMLKSIKTIHDIGILHRDIKPGNFCLSNSVYDEYKRPRCVLIDFGLARRHLCDNGEVREARFNAGFRGTARYASVAAHIGKELGRVDDLWCLFYLTVEFLSGSLPWKGREKDKIGEIKKQHTNAKLVKHLPIQMIHYLNYLNSLQYADKPDYEYVESLYEEMFTISGASQDIPYDWDIAESSNELTKVDESSLTSFKVPDAHPIGSKFEVPNHSKLDGSFESINQSQVKVDTLIRNPIVSTVKAVALDNFQIIENLSIDQLDGTQIDHPVKINSHNHVPMAEGGQLVSEAQPPKESIFHKTFKTLNFKSIKVDVIKNCIGDPELQPRPPSSLPDQNYFSRARRYIKTLGRTTTS